MTVLRRTLLALPVLVLGAAGVVLLAPGGLGDPAPQVVTGGPSAEAYRDVVGVAGNLPGWLHGPGEYGAAAGVLVLIGLVCWTGWSGWRRRTPSWVGALLVSVAAVLAYLVSEALKLVVDQERPCRALGEVTIWISCPPVGDWSFPSNHSTVAGALAGGLVLLAPRLGLVAVPVAVAVAVAVLRVLAGVHYPHDVVAGLLLGASASIALLLALSPAGTWPLTRGRVPAGVSGDGVLTPGRR
ncbi:phosphatase PAP2 family protein [Plantactinospora sp. S1510]|uniref:Phosphatase PAP2 family protein n=1 Tax=Plantactinospora alkalitolerans TaxID=2789879 RepID=A0ABS0GWP1_9ACTN|nr:phosphatase PAP2 family protein [Plantactinospora alkalitolerans]MBF9130626.1 phosphatase PAP2 family protein [Plantactinospora alkalitolerans]